MSKQTTDIVAYLTWVGLIIALVAGDRESSRFHLNQSLVIWARSICCKDLLNIPRAPEAAARRK